MCIGLRMGFLDGKPTGHTFLKKEAVFLKECSIR